MVGQALATVLMLVSMHWFIFLLNVPVAVWNIYRLVWRFHLGRTLTGRYSLRQFVEMPQRVSRTDIMMKACLL